MLILTGFIVEMNIETLYSDNSFNNYLVGIANKNRLDDYDDYKQNVMVELIEVGYDGIDSAKKIAKNIAQRMKRKQINEYAYSLIENSDSYNGESDSVLWEDNHIV